MVSFTVKLRKRIIFLLSIIFIAAIIFISMSIYQWTRLANEEYFYDNPKLLYKKLEEFPSDLNIENIRRIKASVNPSRFKFIIMGDTEGNHKILGKVIKEALTHNPDFIIFLGDLTEQGKLRHYKKELDFIKNNIPIPFVFVIGNHDYYNNGFISYAHIFGPLDFYFDIEKYRFICIDNNFMEKTEELVHLPDSDMEWETEAGIDDIKLALIDSLLREDSHVNIIFMHQPPPLLGWEHHAFGLNAEKFINLIQKFSSKISHVCASHLHGYDKKELFGIKFIISGGAGGAHRSGIDDLMTERYNYVLFEVNNAGIKDKVYFVD